MRARILCLPSKGSLVRKGVALVTDFCSCSTNHFVSLSFSFGPTDMIHGSGRFFRTPQKKYFWLEVVLVGWRPFGLLDFGSFDWGEVYGLFFGKVNRNTWQKLLYMVLLSLISSPSAASSTIFWNSLVTAKSASLVRDSRSTSAYSPVQDTYDLQAQDNYFGYL